MIDHIYISDRRAVIDYDKFDLVINLDFPRNGVKEGEYIDEQLTPKTRLVRIGMKDDEQANIGLYTDKLSYLIKEYVSQHKLVLIHSDKGMGRSAVMMSAYLIKQYRFGFSDISRLYQSSKYRSDMNIGFEKQLQDLSKKEQLR
jgi:protein-tyrosine phosphatase